ncbi:TonB-dependent receptor [Pedobacter nyackensis]|uniref:TonB-dependent receptor n=1 Tax=Pedobacter nyackensis TaxID=475255 RepID=UPI0029303E42|nr:TonB-dependent receptor [Pedobacter nyackensis]
MYKNYANELGVPKRYIKKLLLIMRLTTVILIATIMQVSAAGFAQRITLSKKKATLKSIFKEIRKQSNYDFIYTDELLKNAKEVDINVNAALLEEVLNKVFIGQPLSYTIEDRTVVLKEKLDAPLKIKQADRVVDVRGRVVDTQGKGIPGVTVKIKGETGGGTTNSNGDFSIAVTSSNAILVFSYTGFIAQEVPVNGQAILNVILKESVDDLSEVVVVGYGTQKKITVTGSISSVNMADMRTPVASLSNALAGKVAGIISMQSSGEPGYDNSELTIRGLGTFTGNNSPLIIVDGVQRDDVNSAFGGSFNNIDPEDVASISLLKDASSTAMYGAKGANGVLIITTKRGVAGKPKISFKAETGLTSFTERPKMLNGIQYMELLNEARVNMGQLPNYSDEVIQKTASGLDPYMYPNVNWIDEVYKENSSLTNAHLNINGGSEAVRYYISTSFYNQTGPYNVKKLNGYNPNLNFKRYDFRSNIDVDVTKSTLLQLNIGAMLVNSRYPGIGAGPLWYLAYATTPVAFPTQYPDGKWAGPIANGGANPLNSVQNNGYSDEFRPAVQSVFTVNQKLDVITPGLTSYARFSFDSYGNFNNRRTGLNDNWQAIGRDGNGELLYTQTRIGQQFLGYEQGSDGERVMYLEGNINYDRTFGNHRVGAMFLYNMRNRLRSTAGDVITAIPFRNQSLAGRMTYGFKDKYLLEVNAGYTGSENFQKGSKFGFFSSVSGGWVISNEDFFKPYANTFSLLKLRGSYGVVGNDNIGARDRFPYLTQIGGGSGVGFGLNGAWNGGLTENLIGVENLTWERSYKGGIGLEIGLFNRLNLIIDGFDERRNNILIRRESISSIVGLGGTPVYANLGEMSNRGVDASIEYNDQIGSLGVRLFGNVTYSKNKIIFADEPIRKYAYQNQAGFANNEFFGYVADGYFVDQDDIDSRPEQKISTVRPGDIRYLDQNGDGVIDAYDARRLGKSPFPSWLYGAGFSLAYKKFDLSLFFQGVADVGIMANGSSIDSRGAGANGVGVVPFSGMGQYQNNTMAQALDRWTVDNPRQDAYYPRLSVGSLSDNNYLNSTHWLKDGSYIRLKQASLGYTFTSEKMKKAGVPLLYFYTSGQNLLTFSKFKIWDPELGSNGAKYPISRMVTFGVRAQF